VRERSEYAEIPRRSQQRTRMIERWREWPPGRRCHAINEIGGTSAPPLDVESAPGEVDPLDFVARMWRGAEPMVFMQQSLFGEQLDFTSQELADIIAFAHDPEEQRKFSEADVPPALRRLIREQ
jgi:hypothetical protein